MRNFGDSGARLSWRRLLWRVGVVPLGLTLVAGLATELPRGIAGDLAPGGSATPAANSSRCADVLVVGADGNAERPAPGLTFGRSVETFYRRYVELSHGSAWSVAGRRVAFTGRPVSALKESPRATGPAARVVTRASVDRWLAGTATGVQRAVALLRQQASACPQQQLVLAGYSQGASVLHRALLSLAGDRALVSRVTAVVLLGDGDRARRTAATSLRGAPAASRLGAGAVWLRASRVADLPRPGWTVPVWQVCTQGDAVCDLGSTRIARALALHTNYWRGAAASQVTAAAAQVWARTQLHPKPATDPFPVTADLGTPVTSQLPVDVAPRSAGFVRWSAGAMPPGLVLDSHGVLSGIPTRVGTWRVPYTVSSAQSAEFARRVPGTLEVTVTGTGASLGMVSAGDGQACAVRPDASAWCWGRNDFGQLGNGTTTRSNVPVRPQGLPAAADISTNGSTTCAVGTDHSLWCWGLDYTGQLGIGSTAKRLVPTRVAGSGWTSVSNSWFHTCAVKTDGSLWCWGANSSGQLGDGTTIQRTSPVRVGTGNTWTGVAAGGWHTCATQRDGSLWCWGDNAFGQLGTGSTQAARTPVRVGSGTTWVSVSANWTHTCALQSTGQASCWGHNGDGQLGDGTQGDRISPTPVAGGLRFTDVSAGSSFSCGVTTDGEGWCWGLNTFGQLGDGSRSTRTTPTPLSLPDRVATVAAGWVHSCAVRTDAATTCWGSNQDGQLGDGSYADALTPVATR